jgi:serine/tyrosine/threonine adenylyltransferase
MSIMDWLGVWRTRMAREPQPASEHAAFMRLVNPALIPRNHHVEQVIAAAVQNDDYEPFEQLNQALMRPYEKQSSAIDYAKPPQPHERVLQTFCGT